MNSPIQDLLEQSADEVIDRAAQKLADMWWPEFKHRMENLHSLPLYSAAGLVGCHPKTLERNAPILRVGRTDKSITIKSFEDYCKGNSRTPNEPIQEREESGSESNKEA